MDDATFTPVNKVRRFDLINAIWLPESTGTLPRPILATYSGASPIVNGKMIILGGFTTKDGSFSGSSETDYSRSDAVVVYDVAGQFFHYNTQLPEEFGDHLVLQFNDKIFALGGKTGPLGGLEERTNRMVVGAFAE